VKGSTFRRCGCRGDAGKPLRACPRLGKERGHGSWFYRADVGRDATTGRRREQRKGGFATKAEADAALARVLAAVSTGEHRHDGRQTVGVFLTEWLDRRIAAGLRPSSQQTYRAHVEQDLVPALGTVRLGDLRPGHVDRLIRDLRTAGRGATTIRRVHATLSSALTSARRARLITHNPAADVDLPALPRQKVRPWEPEELAAFLDAASAHRLGGLYEFMAFTGLRRGEACALRWDDVDLERGLLTVRTQLVQVGSGVVEGKPKTRSGEDRRVDLGSRTIGVLLAQQFMQDADLGRGVHRQGAGLRPGGRHRPRARGSHEDVRPAGEGRRPTPGAPARSAARRGLADDRRRRGSGGGVQAARTQLPVDHRGHVLAPASRDRTAGGRRRGVAGAPTGDHHRRRCAHIAPTGPRRRLCGPTRRVNPQVITGAPGGIRTPNLLIRSQVLYPLSYERRRPVFHTGRWRRLRDLNPGWV